MAEALQQYIDLYREHRAELEAASTPQLNRARTRALVRLEAPGAHLPDRRDEGYRHLDVSEMFAPDYGVNLRRLNFDVDMSKAARCDVPNISTFLAVVANDVFRPTTMLQRGLPEGVTMMSLARASASAEFGPIVERYYDSLVPADNVAAALNTLLCTDGVFIHLAPGVELHKPLQLINVFNTEMPLMASRRILVVAERGSRGRLLVCDHTRRPDVQYLSNQVVEVVLGQGANFDVYDMEESSALTRRLSQTFATQAADSGLRLTTLTLLNGRTRNSFDVRLQGEHCENRIAGMVIGAANQVTDNSTLVIHQSGHGNSDQLFKYVLADESHGAFEGLIRVDHGAEHTAAYQTNRNLLASEKARMHTDPQLEIYCDEVKCSHGATVGQLDQNALFYMRQRGIPVDEARMMLMRAFLGEVVATVEIPTLRDRLTHLIEKRLRGESGLCDTCLS